MLKMRLNRHASISSFVTIAFVLLSFTYEWAFGNDDPQKQGASSAPAGDRQNAKPDGSNAGLTNQANVDVNTAADNAKSARKKVRLSGMIGLFMRDQVLKELGIEKGTEEYAELRKLAGFAIDLQNRGNHPTDEDRAERLTAHELYSKVESEHVVILKERLKPEQYSRWQQIWLQRWGFQSIEDSDVASVLGILSIQQERITAIQLEIASKRKTLQEERKELMVKGAGTEEIGKKLQELDAERNRRYQEVMTPEQLDKFNQMKGKQFELASSPPPTLPTRRAGMPIQVRSGGLMHFAIKEPVLKELGINPDAPVVAEIRKLSEAHRQELREGLRGNIEKAYETGEKLQAKYYADLKKLIMPEQFTRLQQIDWQRHGIGAFDDPDLISALGITGEQQKQFDDLTVGFFKKRREVQNSVGADRVVGEPLNPETQTKLEELLAEHKEKINQILTTSQQKKFAELKGKPFDLTQLR